jgi:small subunit ribosomal protein S20
MPNTKSAERRVRSSARKQTANHMVNSRLKTLEKTYSELVVQGKKDDASTAYRDVSAALDKAAKTGVLHRSAANRKKSRLALRLNKMK